MRHFDFKYQMKHRFGEKSGMQVVYFKLLFMGFIYPDGLLAEGFNYQAGYWQGFQLQRWVYDHGFKYWNIFLNNGFNNQDRLLAKGFNYKERLLSKKF